MNKYIQKVCINPKNEISPMWVSFDNINSIDDIEEISKSDISQICKISKLLETKEWLSFLNIDILRNNLDKIDGYINLHNIDNYFVDWLLKDIIIVWKIINQNKEILIKMNGEEIITFSKINIIIKKINSLYNKEKWFIDKNIIPWYIYDNLNLWSKLLEILNLSRSYGNIYAMLINIEKDKWNYVLDDMIQKIDELNKTNDEDIINEIKKLNYEEMKQMKEILSSWIKEWLDNLQEQKIINLDIHNKYYKIHNESRLN